MMKKTHILWLALAAALIPSCAKNGKAGLNDANKEYIESWIKLNYPGADRTNLGSYILKDDPGSGELVGDGGQSPYVIAHYNVADMDGKIQNTTEESVAKRIGTYQESNTYSPVIWDRVDRNFHIGTEEVISSMRVGGKRKVLIPGWLLTYDKYATEKEYMDHVSGTNAIYEISILETVSDIVKWEVDSIGNWLSHNHPSVSVKDSTYFGYYYIRTAEPESERSFPQDTTVYINYTGRLLNGKVFDTTIADTAKVHKIYNASKSYGPVSVKIGELYSDLELGGSTVIDGFAMMVHNMHPFEAGKAIFYSPLGYKEEGSGSTIPGYSPLIFEVQVTKKP